MLLQQGVGLTENITKLGRDNLITNLPNAHLVALLYGVTLTVLH